MLLDIHNLCVDADEQRIVDHGYIRIPRGDIVAFVGGSGSGKTTVGLSILRLLNPGLKVSGGEILWKGEDLLKFTDREMHAMRGGKIAMIFQEPLNAFNPVFNIQDQVDEVLRFHTKLNRRQRVVRIKELLNECGIQDAERVMKSFPHQLSGGLRQRAMIAQALAGEPELIIADEPTSSIDVTLQAKILELFKKLQRRLNLSILLITHDLGLVQHVADVVYVMQEGRVIETGKVADVMGSPKQDYTKKLIEATI